MLEIHHDDTLVARKQLSVKRVFYGIALVSGIVDGVPCIIVALIGQSSGVHIHHALNGQLLRSFSCHEDVFCVCIDRSGTWVLFGTQSGVWVRMTCMVHCYEVV